MTYQDIVNIIRNAANYVNPNGFFIHGRKTDGSLNYNEATPQILLLEPQPNTNINNNSFVETITFPIVFVTQDSSESTELRREDLKQQMYLLSRKLLAKIDEEPLLQNVQFTSGQPEIRQLSGTLTGFSYSLEITYPLSECSLDFDLPPTIKLFATETVVASGTHVQIGWIAENVNSVNITPFGVLQGQFGFVNVTINNTETFIGTATNDAGTDTDSLTISVSNGCADATAELFDTNGNLLSTTPIASGSTEPIIAPDATILINGDNSFPTIPSGGLENIVVENTAGTPVGAYDGNTNSWVTPDITVTDSDGSTFTQPSVTDVVCTPVTPLTVNFSVDDTTPDTNQTITFTDLTVGANQWLWDFGDGTSSNLQNPTKTYKYAGNYTVTLCATNGSISGKEIKTNYIVVTLQTIVQNNLQAHYKSLQGATPANATLVSGAVSQWNDETSNAFHVIQGTVANRPNYNANAITAPDGTVYGAVEFDGSNDFLVNNNAGFTRADGNTLCVFFRNRVALTTLRNMFVALTGTSTIQTEANTLSLRISGSNSFMAYPRESYYYLRVYFSSTNAVVSINNIIDTIIATTSTVAGTGFAMSAATASSAIDIIEAAIYTGNLSNVEVQSNLEYFDAKFGGVICQ
jgi:PKD repeat protein